MPSIATEAEGHTEQLGVATALDRTRALEALLRRAIHDTHAVAGDLSLDADTAELERESLLAVNEQLGLLALKLRQYSQLGPSEQIKKTAVLSELDELRRDLITVSYTSQQVVVVAKDTLRDVRKFAEMQSENDGLSDEDSENYLSDESSHIDDSDDDKQQGVAESAGTVMEGSSHDVNTVALRHTLKTGGSTASGQHRELEEALSRAEAALAQTKTRTGEPRPPALTPQERTGNTKEGCNQQVADPHQPSQKVTDVDKGVNSLLHEPCSLQLPFGSHSKESTSQQQIQPKMQRQQSSSGLERLEKQEALQQANTQQQEGRQSKQPLCVSSESDHSNSASSCTTKFADSPSPLPSHPAQLKVYDSSDDTSPMKGVIDKIRAASAADTNLSGSAGSLASQRLAAWRPQLVDHPSTNHTAGSIANGSSSSSSHSHEGDSASSVTSSDNLCIQQLNSQPSSRVPAHSKTAPTDQRTALPMPATVSVSEPRVGKDGKVDEKGRVDNSDPPSPKATQIIISKQLATQCAPFKPQTLPGTEDMRCGGSISTHGFSSDKTAVSSLAAPAPMQIKREEAVKREVTLKAESHTRRYEPHRSSKVAVRGQEAHENRPGRNPSSKKRSKRRLVFVLTAAVVAGAAALLSPALSSPANEDWKREICERLSRMWTPKELALRIKGRVCPPALPALPAPGAENPVTSPLFEQYPDGNLGRG